MILSAHNVSFSYTCGKKLFDNLQLRFDSAERTCIFGSSGYGKTTLAKILAGLETPDTGQILLDNLAISPKGFYPVQLISQHPETSVNPKWTVKKILLENDNFDFSILQNLDIPLHYLDRYPFELSGGELQRICIARAISDKTKFLIADEITTMLDAITQAKIWQFLLTEVKKRGIGLLVITHNKYLAERVCTKIIDLQKEVENS